MGRRYTMRLEAGAITIHTRDYSCSVWVYEVKRRGDSEGKTAGAMQPAKERKGKTGPTSRPSAVRRQRPSPASGSRRPATRASRRWRKPILGPVRYLALFRGAGDQEVMGWLIPVVASLLDRSILQRCSCSRQLPGADPGLVSPGEERRGGTNPAIGEGRRGTGFRDSWKARER